MPSILGMGWVCSLRIPDPSTPTLNQVFNEDFWNHVSFRSKLIFMQISRVTECNQYIEIKEMKCRIYH